MAYYEALLDNRNNKIEALKEQMSKLDEIEENNPENNMVQTKLFAFLLKLIIISLP